MILFSGSSPKLSLAFAQLAAECLFGRLEPRLGYPGLGFGMRASGSFCPCGGTCFLRCKMVYSILSSRWKARLQKEAISYQGATQVMLHAFGCIGRMSSDLSCEAHAPRVFALYPRPLPAPGSCSPEPQSWAQKSNGLSLLQLSP